MKTKIIFFLFLTVSAISGSAQTEYQLRELMDFVNVKKVISGELFNNLTESEIEGSACLNKEFINGTVYAAHDIKYVDVPLRYNVYNDEMEFKNTDGQILAIYPPESIEKIEIGKNSFSYTPYFLGKNVKSGYLEIIVEGDVSLFIRHKIIFKEAEEAGAYKDPTPPKFAKNPDEYYIRVGNKPASLVKSKKNLLEILSDHKNEIDKFIKKNDTKTNDIESLAELVKYYNTL